MPQEIARLIERGNGHFAATFQRPRLRNAYAIANSSREANDPTGDRMAMATRPLTSGPSLGIRVAGQDAGICFASAVEARESAQLLAMRGYRDVTVFDRLTGQTVAAAERDASHVPLRRPC
jgi:hypothetical protein